MAFCVPASEPSGKTAAPKNPGGAFRAQQVHLGAREVARRPQGSPVIWALQGTRAAGSTQPRVSLLGRGWMEGRRDGGVFRVLQIHRLLSFLQLQVQDLSSKPSFLPTSVLAHCIPQKGQTLGAVGTGS